MDNKKDLVVSLFTDYCGGNKDAFAQLYTETLDYTYRIVRLFIASEQDAEDMVQNVYLKVLEKADTLKNPDCFYTWLRRVTENECKNHLKKHKPVLWSGTQEDFNSSINSERAIVSTAVSVETDEVNKMLFEAIETLPQEKRVCLQLYYFEGADIAEIASALGIPQGTVKTRLFVARKKLEKELKKSGVGKDVFYSVGIIPLIASAFAWHSSKVHAPAALASKASAIASGAAAPTAAAAGVTVASAAGVTAGVVLPKIAAVVTGRRQLQRAAAQRSKHMWSIKKTLSLLKARRTNPSPARSMLQRFRLRRIPQTPSPPRQPLRRLHPLLHRPSGQRL